METITARLPKLGTSLPELSVSEGIAHPIEAHNARENHWLLRALAQIKPANLDAKGRIIREGKGVYVESEHNPFSN